MKLIRNSIKFAFGKEFVHANPNLTSDYIDVINQTPVFTFVA